MTRQDFAELVRVKHRDSALTDAQLAELADGIELVSADPDRALVGMALEGALRDRYLERVSAMTSGAIVELASHGPDTYTARSIRAMSDAVWRVLERRFPDVDPLDSWPDAVRVGYARHAADCYRAEVAS